MKKLVLNISDSDYEKLKFEAIHERKGIAQLIKERVWFKPFHPEVIEAYENYMEQEIERILNE